MSGWAQHDAEVAEDEAKHQEWMGEELSRLQSENQKLKKELE